MIQYKVGKDSNDFINIIKKKIDSSNSIAFVYGNFNIIHPGHLRILNFANECADYLVVGLADNNQSGVFIDQELRLEAVRSIGFVDFVFILTDPIEDFIRSLKPNIIVKGKEHETRFNIEREVVDEYGGKLLFSSGEIIFSSLDMLKKELYSNHWHNIKKPFDYINRHQLEIQSLLGIINNISDLRVLVIGDLIIDEYITCEALGMSQEDPTIVVTPILEDIFVGGAGIVASHASGLGAKVTYIGISGSDKYADFAKDILSKNNVDVNLIPDTTRPTTLKQRFRVQGKTLLRLNRLKQHDISIEISNKILSLVNEHLKNTNLVIFSDFNYGCLPQSLVDEIISNSNKLNVPMVADSQSSSQNGDISRFKGMMLITPTEHEARIAMRDSSSGLIVLADKLISKSNAKNIFITLGGEGLLVHSPSNAANCLITDQLPALNSSPKDVSGAGDCMLTAAALSMVAGADIWTSAYIGSVASACQVSRVGNTPLTSKELKDELIR